MGPRKIENENGVLHTSFIIPVKNYSFLAAVLYRFDINPNRVVFGVFIFQEIIKKTYRFQIKIAEIKSVQF